MSYSATRRATIVIFLTLLGVSAWKYSFEFGQRADVMALAGGPFGQFEVAARFPGIPEETASKVSRADTMTIRGWTLASVVEKTYQSVNGPDGTLHLRLRSPNWLRYYLEPSPGTEIIFQTDAYSLRGVIERDCVRSGKRAG